MKPSPLGIGLTALALVVTSVVASPVIFTVDTTIALLDGTFDGQDIIVSNAVLTVDGPHNFASLRLAGGAVLTHTASSNGVLTVVVQVTDELQTLLGTNAMTLAYSNINPSSVMVRDQVGSLTYTNGADYYVGGYDFFTTLQRTENSAIPDGATVRVNYQYSQPAINAGLNLTVSGNLEVETGASINANGRGYSQGVVSGSQTGFPPSGGGGGHGGYGGVSSTNAAGGLPYGSPYEPGNPGGCGGSGLGGFGAAGGGIVNLVVGSNLVVNGSVTVNGLNATNSRSGGGAGGSIWVTAQTISGNGSMSANGGAGEPIHGGGGGGGRIAIEFSTNLFTGTITAFGGNGWQRGGAGSIFVRSLGTVGEVRFDNSGIAGAATLINLTTTTDVIIQGRAAVLVSNPQTVGNLTVRSNSSITTVATNNATLTLTATGDAVIENGAIISVNGKGFPANQGTGLGQTSQVVGSGAGHGGYGGSGQTGTASASGGNYYGSLTSPTTYGSGGRTVGSHLGGAGGGAVRLAVTGNLRLDGQILVDGTAGIGSLSGGAAGGSVWLTLGGFSGAGKISATGGSGGLPSGGGGAGGRIALTCNSNSFAGTLTAVGGNGAVAGSAGTIYTKRNSETIADLTVNNGGLTGTNTVLDVNANYNLAVLGGAALRVTSATLLLGNLDVGNNSALLVGPMGTGSASLLLNIASNATVAAGGSILGDGFGSASGTGTGAGGSFQSGSTGGGHGGYGGRGAGFPNIGSPGGNIYDSTASPQLPGSGGGSTLQQGGAGGAALRMNVTGNLVMDGRISVNGLSTSTNNAGGGSGGSLWLALNRFSGSGTISADGGAGHLPNGGGGGGGRIAITWNSNVFTGTYSAKGGNGFVAGGAGTIYLKANQRPIPDLIFDNGGLLGTNTVLDVSSIFNLTIGSGASVMLPATIFPSVSVSNLTITANGAWRVGALNLTVTVGTATIAAGGSLSADFTGTSSIGGGTGPYNALGSGGGGHGGYGGRGAGTSGGGNFFDSASNPQQAGSPGGNTAGGPSGSPGGGALRMTVSGPLVLNGRISADGANSSTNNGGGGSGGSLWLTLNQLSGSGTISANGGSGHLPNGGGGGGGRIALYFNTNSFTGSLSAKGGNGFMAGGAGTIYLRRNQNPAPDLIVDNGGLAGTNTVLDVTQLINLTIGPGAGVISSVPIINITSNLTIGANAVLRAGTLTLTAGSANIAVGGALVADGTSTIGIGTGQSSSLGSSGAGHAGYGGRGAGTPFGGNVYDNIANPMQGGSQGGFIGPSAAAGGGSLRLTVSGPLVLEGRISANGSNSLTNNGGGGSGGSVWLTLNQFSGTGDITANGGSGHLPNGGGGGGGRVAVYYNSNSFTGSIAARGGDGFAAGGAGTIYLRRNQSQAPDLIVDNGGLPGTNTVLDVYQLINLTIGPGASVVSSVPIINITSNLTIGANAVWRAGTLTLTAGSANIAAGGGIVADGGSTIGIGTGQSSSLGSSGAGHAGYGGRGAGTPFGGNVYGNIASPAQGGSQGGFIGPSAAAGGGSLRLTVSGPLVLEGHISANGLSSLTNNGGGGSGGSIWLTLNQLSGAGDITANGGMGHLPNGGGGGGGRIALYFNTNTFTGSLSAKGGNGFAGGGAGTIYLRANNQQLPSVTIDNGGLFGTNTVIDISSISNLTIAGAARLQPPSGNLFVGNLNIATNSVLLGDVSRSGGLNLNISGVANVAAGGRISADGLSIFILGNGSTGTPGSGGGGHGGYGGRGVGSGLIGGPSSGGNAFGSLANPNTGGGNGGGLSSGGGIGGGTIRITASGPFILDGMISANGLNTSTNGSGGGAGGSVWLTFNELIGTGTITADGGSGHLPNGGGGGGGRVSVSYNFLKGNFPTNGFTGAISAKGGAGYVKGGAGTIYVRTNNSNIANVFVDNGGTRGTNTLVSGGSSFDLYVQGAALATSLGAPRDLFVRSNSWVVQTGNWSVSRNATFDADGGIDLDGLGTSTAGRGSTFANPKGGGGHGGYGGVNPPNSGNAYDLAALPSQDGSRGGNGSGSESLSPFGGNGGGATHFTVGNTLTLNGEISADGNDGELNSGGGSGGSVWIQTATLTGSGLITATGGDGNGPAGGGGGGRIAIYYNTNQFTGLLSACGGAGGVFGGAGTIYSRDNVRTVTSLVLDNCGNWGANTPLSQSIGLATNLTVTGSAMAEMQGTIPLLSNIVVSAGGEITSGRNDTNLFLSLLGNLTVTEDAGIVTDAKGFARDSGPGYGGTFNNQGAGGSHGGWGGDSASGAFSGMIYGSATKPVDRGSGGGSGSGYPAAGSEGGGAIRLVVAGTVELNGLISASGGTGWQDDAGGGSGGSVWISTRKFTGDGTLAAIGGDGDFFGGGGGGGGRIAIYSPMNTFTGLVSVIGGDGANFGEAGTIFTSGSLSGMDVIAQTPTGIVSNVVSQVALEFTEPINLASVSAGDVRIYTPYGLLPSANQTFSSPAPSTLLVSFNPQNVPGNYRVEVGPLIEGLLAPRMSQVHTGAFSITLPIISGTVMNLNGQPVAGVTLLPTGGLMGVTTDANGNYSLGLPPGWNVSVTPALGTNAFIPGQLSYTNVSASLAGQNYLMVPTIAPTLTSSLSGAGLSLNWSGMSGMTYQPEYSTNLVDWLPYGSPLSGTNGLMQLLVPTSGDPLKFVRLRAAN